MILSLLLLSGCAGKKAITYDINTGYDVSRIKAEEIIFRIYHSDTEDHIWEKLAEFHRTPQKDCSPDVRAEADQSRITLTLTESTKKQENNIVIHNSVTVSSAETEVSGFAGDLPGSVSFEIFDRDGEQMMRLYPVNNGNMVTYSEIYLDKPYDDQKENLDNILVTIEFVK